jgi:hypothetical protein
MVAARLTSVDHTLRERLISFESRIASLLEMKEQMRGEMEAFEPLFEEMEFISDIFDDNTRYEII